MCVFLFGKLGYTFFYCVAFDFVTASLDRLVASVIVDYFSVHIIGVIVIKMSLPWQSTVQIYSI